MGPFDSPPMGSYYLHSDAHGLSLSAFELFSWLQKRFRPPDPDTLTITALESVASLNRKRLQVYFKEIAFTLSKSASLTQYTLVFW